MLSNSVGLKPHSDGLQPMMFTDRMLNTYLNHPNSTEERVQPQTLYLFSLCVLQTPLLVYVVHPSSFVRLGPCYVVANSPGAN